MNLLARGDLLIRGLILVLVGFYTIFAVLVYKQVGILNKTIITPKAGLVNALALLHLVASVAGLLLAALAIFG